MIYPRMLFRDGGSGEIWGRPMETRIVDSEAEELEALSDGWRLHPIAQEGGDPAAPAKRGPGRPRKVQM